MKYQSELIKEMVDSRGHEKSSLHYQSECVETWIEENKGAYPKLCDYESEWLNYINENPIGEFPYETVSTNTTATVNHVVPYAYKSAILKGNTSYKVTQYSFLVGKYLNVSNGSLNVGSSFHLYCEDYFLIPNGTQITLRGNNNYKKICYYDVNKNFISGEGLSTELLTDFTTVIPSNAKYFRFNTSKTDITSPMADYLKIYIDDDLYLSNEEYIQEQELISVKMPVLTTSNEDGTKTNILTVNEDVTLRGIGEVKDELDCLTGKVTKRIEEIVLVGGDDEEWYTSSGGSATHKRFILKRGDRIKPISNVNENLFLCDKFNTVDSIKGENSKEMCLMEESDEWYLSIIIDNTKLNSLTVNGFKTWLQSNNVKLQYVVESESIKTVDLSVTNQDGNTLIKIKPIEGTMHITPTGEPIAPTAVLEVPVEAITQNLASFIKEE